MPISITEARQIFAKIESVGGKVPTELTGMLELEARVRNIETKSPKFALTDLEAVTRLTEAQLASALQESAAILMADNARADLLRRLEVEIPVAITSALRGPLGDQLFDSLRPVVAEHVSGLDRVGDALPADVTADQVLQMDDAAAAAWREGPRHKKVLDDILWGIVRPIAADVIIPDPALLQHGQARFLIFMVDLAANPSPDALATDYSTKMQTRFGGWRALSAHGPITLNTPSRVRAYLDQLTDAVREVNNEKYRAKSLAG